jgi:hypothetical protein
VNALRDLFAATRGQRPLLALIVLGVVLAMTPVALALETAGGGDTEETSASETETSAVDTTAPDKPATPTATAGDER